MFDTVARAISIPPVKVQEIVNICTKWSLTRSCAKSELQPLLAVSLYQTKCVKPVQYFLNRMLKLLRDNVETTRFQLFREFHNYLNRFLIKLVTYNGITMSNVRPFSCKHIF